MPLKFNDPRPKLDLSNLVPEENRFALTCKFKHRMTEVNIIRVLKLGERYNLDRTRMLNELIEYALGIVEKDIVEKTDE